MRRTLAAAVVALSTALTAAPAVSATTPTVTAPRAATAGVASADRDATAVKARAALATASDLVTGDAAPSDGVRRVDATLALTDLFARLDHLRGPERTAAEALLARPTDGAGDDYGDGYTVRSKKKCAGNFCLHWVPTTADAPPGMTWVNRNLALLNKVWRFEVGKLGYRKPVSDGFVKGRNNGGNGKFDVYLADVGSQGLYGYCAPEYVRKGKPRLATGFCVLDNDFSRDQFSAPPRDSLRVTAAHEFFHAIQFGYDYLDDRWFKESTATWIEERFADDVNDNRSYLVASQVQRPGYSMDVSGVSNFQQYGNWTWWEYLTVRYGAGIVRKVWNGAGQFKGAGRTYSTKALTRVLGSRGGFRAVYNRYVGANVAPGRFYPEGGSWPSAKIGKTWKLTEDQRTASGVATLNHLAARNFAAVPGGSLESGRWRAKITVDGPAGRTSPAAYLTVKNTRGAWVEKAIRLNRDGRGSVVLPFSARKVREAVVSTVNASTRFADCGGGSIYSCGGTPRDEGKKFRVSVKVYKKSR